MAERVVGFHGGRFEVDDEDSFFVHFEATEAQYNGKPVDMEWKGCIELERTQPGDDYFIEALLKKGEGVYISFDCSVSVTRISPRSIQVIVDGGKPFAVGVNPLSITCGEEVTDFTQTDTFEFRRSSGESPTIIKLKLKKRRLRVWFTSRLKMGFIAIVHDPERAHIFRDLKPMGVTTDNRIEAYKYQQLGMRALLPREQRKGDYDEWETVVLTDDELRQLEASRKAKRQAKFDENCGC